MTSKAKTYIALHAMLVLYSFSGICGKLAAQFDFLSVPFIACYAGMVGILGIYAIGWQQVIKRMPLTLAYANRAVTVVWGIVWGAVLFSEPLNVFKLVGALVVLAGVALFAYADAEDGEQDAQLADGSLLAEVEPMGEVSEGTEGAAATAATGTTAAAATVPAPIEDPKAGERDE